MQIKTKTIADAHLKLCKSIFEDGWYDYTEDGEKVMEYPEPILVIIENPLSENMISPLCGFGKQAFEAYSDNLLNDSDNDFVYTYHDRLFKYGNNINQIKNIIQKLKQDPGTRRAQAITWYPHHDLHSKTPPCLQRIQFMIRDDALNMYVEFRSNDCLSAFNQNAYAFAQLQNYVAEQVNYKIGKYYHYIVSAHMYYERDAEEINKLKLWCYK